MCDAEQLISFLKANDDKAKAWVEALNADPNLRWEKGALTVADIPAYVAKLTPTILRADTLVLNHGYKNGKPTYLNTVLQKGSAVMVDQYGVPRVRCYCGNPLATPKVPATTLSSPPPTTATTPATGPTPPPTTTTKRPCVRDSEGVFTGCESTETPAIPGDVEITGESWDSLSIEDLSVTTQAEDPLPHLDVTIVETGEVESKPIGPSCEVGAECPELEAAYESIGKSADDIPRVEPGVPADGAEDDDADASPTPSAEPTPTVPATPQLSTTAGSFTYNQTMQGSDTYYYFSFSGYRQPELDRAVDVQRRPGGFVLQR